MAGSGFWHRLLGLDRAGNPLTPIYTGADARGTSDAAALREKLDERAVQQRTGCMLRASFWPAKLGWLRRTDRKLFRRVARWVSPAEWIFEELFGVRVCSHSMASGTGLYNFTTADWDGELMEFTGLTSAQLNPLRDQVESFFPAIGDGAASNPGSGAALAKQADVAIVFAHQWSSEDMDLPNLSLPENQNALIDQIASANPRTIVVLETGTAVTMPWLDKVSGVLEAWYAGSKGADAVANILFGDVNPDATLPMPFPRRAEALPHPPHTPALGPSARGRPRHFPGRRLHDRSAAGPALPRRGPPRD